MVNTFFQINIKGEGYKFIWLLQDNKNLNLLKFIPNLKEYVIGVSLGFVFYKTDNYIFYINLCRLGIKDEYGRYGVLFNQGGFVECTKLNMNLVLEILNHVLSIRENLKNDYNRIVYNLQQIADSEKKFNFDILNEIALIRDYNLQFIFDKYNLSAFNRIIENKNINFVTPFEENIDYTLCRILYNFLKKEMNFNLASGELISFSDFKYSINTFKILDFENIQLKEQIEKKQKKVLPIIIIGVILLCLSSVLNITLLNNRDNSDNIDAYKSKIYNSNIDSKNYLNNDNNNSTSIDSSLKLDKNNNKPIIKIDSLNKISKKIVVEYSISKENKLSKTSNLNCMDSTMKIDSNKILFHQIAIDSLNYIDSSKIHHDSIKKNTNDSI